MFRLTAENWYPVMVQRPTEALWGVGRKTARKLATADPATLVQRLGPAMGRGTSSSRRVWTPHPSAGHRTCCARAAGKRPSSANLTDWELVRAEVALLARFAPFFTHTRSLTLPAPTSDPALLEDAALEVLERFEHDRPVRLLGVRAEFLG